MKKVIVIIVTVVVICIVGVTYILLNNSQKEANKSNNQQENNDDVNVDNNEQGSTNDEVDKVSMGKTLVVYFSAQNHTKTVANKIAEYLNADTFEIIPNEKYTSEDLDWTNSESRVSKEYNDENLRNITLVAIKVDNWDSYDTILIGYPIWWGIVAWPVNTFVKNNDFSGKTVIPFCTSSSSSLGQSGDLLKGDANSGNWLEGHRFSSNASDSDIKSWINSINK